MDDTVDVGRIRFTLDEGLRAGHTVSLRYRHDAPRTIKGSARHRRRRRRSATMRAHRRRTSNRRRIARTVDLEARVPSRASRKIGCARQSGTDLWVHVAGAVDDRADRRCRTFDARDRARRERRRELGDDRPDRRRSVARRRRHDSLRRRSGSTAVGCPHRSRDGVDRCAGVHRREFEGHRRVAGRAPRSPSRSAPAARRAAWIRGVDPPDDARPSGHLVDRRDLCRRPPHRCAPRMVARRVGDDVHRRDHPCCPTEYPRPAVCPTATGSSPH